VSKQRLFAEAALRRLDVSIHASRLALAPCDGARDAFDHLIHAVRGRTAISSRRAVTAAHSVERALAAMALHRADWLRPLVSWCPPVGSAWPVLASLSEHLFARFPIPRFLASAWRDGDGEIAPLPQHRWYVQLGRGDSVRKLGLPLRLTRAMAHRFLQAADHLSIVGALRWAQLVTLGGSDALVRAVLGTRLGRELGNEDAWDEVFRFFVRHPELPLEQIGPIVDFVQHQRFEVRQGVTADGAPAQLPPPRPDFSLKGRTPASLLRLVAAWHGDLALQLGPSLAWRRSPIREYTQIERVPRSHGTTDGHDASPADDTRVWTITELCSSHELRVEGLVLQHCVRTYAPACYHGRRSIWSMQLETPAGRNRRVTIELATATRRIVQARRKRNARPSPTERAVIEQWAAREGLVVGGEAFV